jgi:hypothetical protein
MTHESLVTRDWESIVTRLGGAKMLEVGARETKAFLRPRVIKNAVDLLRMILAYCLGEHGLRLTTAWATAIGLVDISNVALLYRLRACGDWLALLVGETLAAAAPAACRGRLIRIIDATTVPKAGAAAKRANKLWRIHSAFDLPHERFGHFELTDERAGETLDRIPVVAGEIRIGDRAYLQADRIALVLEKGADVLVRAGWKGARWRDADGQALDLIAEFRKAAASELIDRPIWIARQGGAPLALRLVAVSKPPRPRVARPAATRSGKATKSPSKRSPPPIG